MSGVPLRAVRGRSGGPGGRGPGGQDPGGRDPGDWRVEAGYTVIMPVQILAIDVYEHTQAMTHPIRAGEALLDRVTQWLVRVTLADDQSRSQGVASEALLPGYILRVPASERERELSLMRESIRAAVLAARQLPQQASVFDLVQALGNTRATPRSATTGQAWPTLLVGFGTSLVERAVIDAFCRGRGLTFREALLTQSLGMRLGDIHPELAGQSPADYLPHSTPTSLTLRQPIAPGDPITREAAARLFVSPPPPSVEDAITRDGLTHFTILLTGHAEADLAHLSQLAKVIEHASGTWRFVLDGDERYREASGFAAFWERLSDDVLLRPFLAGLLCVQQPIAREAALSEATATVFADWSDRPPIVIDASDDSPASLRRAFHVGYAGTTLRSSRSVLGAVANACLIAHLNRKTTAGIPHLSQWPILGRLLNESAASYGMISGEGFHAPPLALFRHMALAATLGLDHIACATQHVYASLAALPPALQTKLLTHHADLLQPGSEEANAKLQLRITQGQVNIASVLDAPFGVGYEDDLGWATPVLT